MTNTYIHSLTKQTQKQKQTNKQTTKNRSVIISTVRTEEIYLRGQAILIDP